jgi:elongator complex protein 1
VTAEYIFYVARGSTTPSNDLGAVAVIDGEEVKITAFRTANIPPPMALHIISVSHNISDVAFDIDNKLIAISHQDGLAIYGWDVNPNPSAAPTLIGRFTFKKSDRGRKAPLQICVDGNQDLLTLQHSDEGKTVVHRYGFSEETGRVEEKTFVPAGVSSIMMISSFDQDGVTHPFAQHASGHLYSLKSEFNSMPLVDLTFPLFLPWAELVMYNENPLAFGLSKNGHLYANSRLLVKNCTSFLLTPLHLVFTTTTHLLKFVHITDVEG